MESQTARWSAPSLTRNRTAVVALAAVALGCSLYSLNQIRLSFQRRRPSAPSLRRSNARRQRRPTVQSGSEDGNPSEELSRGQEAQDAGYIPRLIDSSNNAMLEELPATAEVEVPVTEGESEHSTRHGRETKVEESASEEGQSLLNLLFHIADEKARKDGYVHRRVACDSCHTMPIRGIRYHCANCRDYDLCEQCEGLQQHPKTHVFYKIRIPAPFIRNPEPEPVWYPGRPHAPTYDMPKEITTNICERTGLQDAEVEALWEQFRCLAATEWPEDPFNYHLAIDRQTFDKCFIPQTLPRQPTPNLIFDRLFASYDQNNDGLIGFNEFIDGVAILRRSKVDERRKRVFQGYDINGDGYVDRRDFLHMFKAHYALSKELIRSIVTEMEEDVSNNEVRDLILGSQPISSAFSRPYSPGERSRNGLGKARNAHGDLTISDDQGVLDSFNHDLANPHDVIGEKWGMEEDQALCFELIREIDSASWPPENVFMADVEEVLKTPIPPTEVYSASDQNLIRRVAHARLAKDHQSRSRSRRLAVEFREERKAFYIDDENSSIPARALALKTYDKVAFAGLGEMRSSSFSRLRAAGLGNDFSSLLEEKINRVGWPVYDSPQMLVQNIIEMISRNWTGLAMVEDLRGYASCADLTETAGFVQSIFELLEKMAGNSSSEMSDPNAFHQQPKPLPRRSRSSSKVRFEDDVGTDDDHQARSRATSTSSRSIPIHERWGGIEMPEPEEDVGQEALYHSTQEALNELLDPIFKLREDLAMTILRTKYIRESSRAETAASVEDSIALNLDIWLYQQRWRGRNSRSDGSMVYFAHALDESEPFQDFLRMRVEGEMNELTGDKCLQCAQDGHEEWIGLGNRCGRCARPSDFQGMPAPLERCSHCAQTGKESVIGGTTGAFACSTCGRKSQFYVMMTHTLLDIIRGVDPHSEVHSPTKEKDPAPARKPSNVARPSTPTPFRAPIGLDDSPLSREASPPPDPTLPQNRIGNSPRSAEGESSGSTSYVNRTSRQDGPSPFSNLTAENASSSTPLTSEKPSAGEKASLDKPTLRFFAALNLIEYTDNVRGGAGRLDFEEFDQVMRGQKGQSLKFLETWIEMPTF